LIVARLFAAAFYRSCSDVVPRTRDETVTQLRSSPVTIRLVAAIGQRK
jgi:hypothetical protein